MRVPLLGIAFMWPMDAKINRGGLIEGLMLRSLGHSAGRRRLRLFSPICRIPRVVLPEQRLELSVRHKVASQVRSSLRQCFSTR